jgi:hypothetical protein
MGRVFYVDGSGYLTYAPFERFRLPKLVKKLDEKGQQLQADFRRHNGDATQFRRGMWRLAWDGEGSGDTRIPVTVARHWPRVLESGLVSTASVALHPEVEADERGLGRALDGPLLGELLKAGVLTEQMPTCLAYNLAVDRDWYMRWSPPVVPPVGAVHYGVGALPAKRVAEVLEWLATAHRNHPLLTGYDTLVNDGLQAVSEAAVRTFFYLLDDYRYDREKKYYARDHRWWPQLAGYLFWVGHAGQGAADRLAGWPMPHTTALEHASFEQELPDLADGALAAAIGGAEPPPAAWTTRADGELAHHAKAKGGRRHRRTAAAQE